MKSISGSAVTAPALHLRKQIVLLVVIGFFVLIALWIHLMTVDSRAVKLGVILPLSGSGSLMGEEAKNGIELAQSNAMHSFDIIWEDSQTQTTAAVSAAQKLISQDCAELLITWLSGPSAAIAPLADEHSVLLLYGSTIDTPAKTHSFVFKNHFNILRDCQALARHLAGRKGRLLGINVESTHDCVRGFQTEGIDLNPELFNQGERDFKAALGKIKSDNPDFLVIRTLGPETELIFKQLAEIGFENVQIVCPTISGIRCDTTSLLATYPVLLKDAIGTDLYLEDATGPLNRFVTQYYERFGRKPTTEAVFAYEDLLLLDQALTHCTASPISDCVRQYLLENELEGVSGSITFDSDRTAQHTTTIETFDGTQWIPLR